MSVPFFSIITPTLQRPSLTRCCESVNDQSFKEWEHIVYIDAPLVDEELLTPLSHNSRIVICDGKRYGNFGNTPRHKAWDWAKGEYVLYLDDDNFLAYPDVLRDIHSSLSVNNPQWAIFPILRFGQRFFTDDPRSCHIDTANSILRREIARWPLINDYTADGIMVDNLRLQSTPYAIFPHHMPIVVMPTQGKGEF